MIYWSRIPYRQAASFLSQPGLLLYHEVGTCERRPSPPGLAVMGKKQDQVIVIYEPWAKEMRKLALRAQALSWDMGKLNREVARKAFLLSISHLE